MRKRIVVKALDRRELLVTGASAAALMAAFPNLASAAEADDRRSVAFWSAYRLLVGETVPEEGQLTLVLDEIAENGNNVPFEISVESPMMPDDHIRSLHLLSTANPQAAVAAFRLSPLSGKAAVKGRMRLARTQDVVALAERSDGKFLVATRRIEVTIGGCGN